MATVNPPHAVDHGFDFFRRMEGLRRDEMKLAKVRTRRNTPGVGPTDDDAEQDRQYLKEIFKEASIELNEDLIALMCHNNHDLKKAQKKLASQVERFQKEYSNEASNLAYVVTWVLPS